MLRRYVRAFWIALKMTLRGETLPPPPDAPLREWISQGIQRADMVSRLTGQHQIDPDRVVLHIDMRDVTMTTILRILRYHLTDEYPILLQRPSPQSMTILHATNLDDYHRVSRLEGAPELADSPVQKAVAALALHLESIPKNK